MIDARKLLEEAKDEVARLERMIASQPCSEVGHRWVALGGRNVGCGEGCDCSVPVNECSVCGDCDYGENEWMEKVRAECELNNS